MSSDDFIELAKVNNYVGGFINVAGVVTEYRDPMTTRKDFMCTFRICDRTRSLNETAMLVRLFSPDPDSLPKIVMGEDKIHHIAVFYNLKIMDMEGNIGGVSHRQHTKWAICSVSPYRTKKGLQSLNLKLLHSNAGITELVETAKNICKDLAQFAIARGGTASAYGVDQNRFRNEILPAQEKKRKLSMIKDIREGNFYDIKGLVVRTYADSAKVFTIYITDFTKNDALYDYDSNGGNGGGRSETEGYAFTGGGVYRGNKSAKWRAPPGRYTLQVALWETPGKWASRNVHEGDFVLLQNVKAKMSRQGDILEAAVNPDPSYPEKQLIQVLKDGNPALKELQSLKRKFDQEAAKQRNKEEQELKRQREEKQRLQEEQELKRKNEINKNVTTGFPSVISTNIGEILKLPQRGSASFVNYKYRVRGRVIDFAPSNLEDFCVRSSSVNLQPDVSQMPAHTVDICDDAMEVDFEGWTWNFMLKVKGLDGETLDVYAYGDDAEFLLGGLKPCNLREDNKQLQVVRETLFLLWGNLEERKKENRISELQNLLNKTSQLLNRVKNNGEDIDALREEAMKLDKDLKEIEAVSADENGPPFECLLKEVGAIDDTCEGIKQRFLIFETSIKLGK